jgi:hypothetical protein
VGAGHHYLTITGLAHRLRSREISSRDQQSSRGWKRAQQRLRTAVGEVSMSQLERLLFEVTRGIGVQVRCS